MNKDTSHFLQTINILILNQINRKGPYCIRTPSRYTFLKSLSSGDIQELILARELSRNPSVLGAAQPARGLDISATEYVHRQLMEQRTKLKTATLLLSDDLDEILSLAVRIAVI